jgi:hypothetical protein
MGLLKVFLLSTIFFVLSFSLNFAQQIHFFSDYFRGGITGGGYNPLNFDFTGQIDLNIPLGATVRKAFLFSSASKHIGFTDFPEPRTILINGQSVTISMDDALNNNYIVGSQFIPLFEMRTIIKDITNLNLSSVINISPPSQILPPYYWEYYILVLYENSLLPYVVVDVYINAQNADSLMNYTLNTSLVLDTFSNIGLALNASQFCETIQDGSNVLINGNAIGLIGGEDYNTPSSGSCVGTTAGFYYENNSLFGLGDDTPNEFMSGSDALANIQNYVINNQQVDVGFAYQSDYGPKSNPVNQLYLT